MPDMIQLKIRPSARQIRRLNDELPSAAHLIQGESWVAPARFQIMARPVFRFRVQDRLTVARASQGDAIAVT
jgi:hypothetical protein